MNKRTIEFSNKAREELNKGVTKLVNAVSVTLGPSGRNVIIGDTQNNPSSTKDGVTVARSVYMDTEMQDLGAQLVKQASIKTGEQAGDGTTTSTLLAGTLFEKSLEHIEKSNKSSVDIKRGIDQAAKDAVSFLKEMSEDVTEEQQLKQIATISGNNDSEVGELISSAMKEVGRDGIITVEESRTGETYLEVVEGIQFDRGHKSPYFITDQESMQTVLKDPYILLIDRKLVQVKELLPLLETISGQNKSLLIIAEDIEREALSTLIVNTRRGTLQACAVKAPGFGDRRKEMLEDIATLTGGQVVSKDKGMRLDRFEPDWLGKARKVVITKGDTTIIDGDGSEDAIVERAESLKTQIDQATSPYEIEQLQDRLGRMVGGISVVHVGGHTEVEVKEKIDRVEDALHATRAAVEEGILPGGGIALLRTRQHLTKKLLEAKPTFNHPDESIGYSIFLDSILAPCQKILLNAIGDEEKVSEILEKIKDTEDLWNGYDPRTMSYVDMREKGIIDPTKVTRLALENAVSVAGTLLITECVIAVKEDESSSQDQAAIQQQLAQMGM